jgi:hypothetical protein
MRKKEKNVRDSDEIPKCIFCVFFRSILSFLFIKIDMSNTQNTLRIPPIRSIREFVGSNEWSKPTLNPNEFGELQKKVISNLIYYQSNYGAIAIPLLLLVAFFRPTAIIFGLLVLAVLLAGFFYATRQNTPLTTLLNDRPIAILVLLLVAAFMVIRMFGTVFAFLFGIALPLAGILGHATARTPKLQNKVANAVENLSLQATPMGLLLSWLGAKSTDEQSTPPPTKGK